MGPRHLDCMHPPCRAFGAFRLIPMQDLSKALLAPFWGELKPKTCLAPYRMMPGNRRSSKPELIFARLRLFRSIWRIPAVDILLLHSGCLVCDVDLPSFWNPAINAPLQTCSDSCDIPCGLDHIRPQRGPWLSRTILSKAIGVGWAGSFTWRPLTPMNLHWSSHYWDISQAVALSLSHCLRVSALHALVKSSFCLLLGYALIPCDPRFWKAFGILTSCGVFLVLSRSAPCSSSLMSFVFPFSTPMPYVNVVRWALITTFFFQECFMIEGFLLHPL